MATSSETVEETAYLDNAATTPLRPAALEAMLPFLTEKFGNPSGIYRYGREARRAIDEARDEIAQFVGCEPGEVIFTSGGTESDNIAIQGVASRRAGAVVTTSIEHHAVLNPAQRAGAKVVGADGQGVIDLEALAEALDESVALVSVMAVNNELGTIQPLDEIAALVRRRAPKALVHSDAVQAAPWFDLSDVCRSCDLVSLSGHKIGGPKGVGVLVVRANGRGKVLPLAIGGGQERAMRPGTENVAGIVGVAAAARDSAAGREAGATRVRGLRDRFLDGLARSTDVQESVPRAATAPGFAHVRFPGLLAEELLVLLDERGVSASAGSACSSGALEPSHVLMAIGWPSATAREGVRFSLGSTTSAEAIDFAIREVTAATAELASRMSVAEV